MGLFSSKPKQTAAPTPPSDSSRRAQRQYDHDVEAWRNQNKTSVRGKRQADDLLVQAQEASDCGDVRRAQQLARQAYSTRDAAVQAELDARQRMQNSRRDL